MLCRPRYRRLSFLALCVMLRPFRSKEEYRQSRKH